MGHRVLAVDMDPQGNLTMSLGLDPEGAAEHVRRAWSTAVNIEEALMRQELDVVGLEHRSGSRRDSPKLTHRPRKGAQ